MATELPPGVEFKTELFARVDAYFSGSSRHASPGQWAKVAFFLSITAALWATLAFVALPWWALVLVAPAAGFCMAQVGFNVGHDAVHGSLSKHRWVNAVFARSFDVMGASSRMWAWAHNVVHHTYTNVPGTDHDLEPGFFLHLYPHRTRGFLHRFQYVYAWGLYCLTMVVWVFKKDFAQLLEKRDTTWRDVADVVAGKLLHFALWLGVPLLFGVNGAAKVLTGYALVLAVCGLVAAVVFQLAHVVEGPEFPGAMADDFWTHQLKTTANFAPRSALATFFTGGLNHQVEHHLFPRVSHAHYPALSALVEDAARKHGLPYHSSPTVWHALASHARTLKRAVRDEAEAPAHVPGHAEPA